MSRPMRRRADVLYPLGLALTVGGFALLVVAGYHAALAGASLVAVGSVIASATDRRAGAR